MSNEAIDLCDTESDTKSDTESDEEELGELQQAINNSLADSTTASNKKQKLDDTTGPSSSSSSSSTTTSLSTNNITIDLTHQHIGLYTIKGLFPKNELPLFLQILMPNELAIPYSASDPLPR